MTAVGVDTGGTFTDVVTADGVILKLPSTPQDPSVAVRDGANRAIGGRPDSLAHGTTVATNALLERAGAPVTLVTTEGFADVIEIGRQARPSLYDPWIDRPEPLVPRAARLEVRERMAADGTVLVALTASAIDDLVGRCDPQWPVAVALLHSDLYPDHERQLVAALRESGFVVCASHEVSPEFREYERTVTTVMNTSLQPVCGPYLRSLADAADDVTVMSSSGGRVSIETAAHLPAALLLSGPAGGVAAAAGVAVACGFPDAVTFDMGGTSTDVCLILDGRPAPAAQRSVDGWPIRMPSLDVHTIGAGGGSIARLDAGGALRVGPESAGARPGPACYGHGGAQPTVTDANLLLGRIPSDTAFSGLGVLDEGAASAAFESAGVEPDGVIDVVNAEMTQALRAVTVERGVDPQRLALIAFGGAGPLHACDLADSLGADVVIIPGAAGVLSAVGLLTAPRRRELVRSWADPSSLDGLGVALAELAASAVDAVSGDLDDSGAAVEVSTELDCRYRGQSHELRVASIDEFPQVHADRNGYVPTDAPIEVTALRSTASVASPVQIEDVLAAVERGAEGQQTGPVVGPQVLVRADCTVWVPEGWRGEPGALGSLILRRSGADLDAGVAPDNGADS